MVSSIKTILHCGEALNTQIANLAKKVSESDAIANEPMPEPETPDSPVEMIEEKVEPVVEKPQIRRELRS